MALSIQNFNPFTAAQAGANLDQGIEDNRRKTLAYNALRAMYGDVAGDPAANQQLFATSAAQQKLPGELEEQGLKNQSTRHENAFNEALNPMKLEKSRLDLDFTRQTQPTAIQDAQEQLRTSQLANQKTQAGMSDDEAERKRTVITGVVAAIKDRIARGEDPAKVFDEVAPQIAAMGGIDPAALRAQRDALVRDPAGTVKAWDQAIGAAWPNADAARTANSAAKLDLQERALKLKEQKQNPPVTEAGVAGLLAKNRVLDRAFDRLGAGDSGTGLSGEVTDSPFLRGFYNVVEKGFGTTPSETENEYRAELSTIQANLGLDVLRGLKQQGVGLGSVTEAEHRLTQAAAGLANAAQSRNPAKVREALIELRRTHREVWGAVMSDLQKRPGGMDALRAIQGRDPTAAPAGGAPQGAPAPTGAPQGGLSPERQRALGAKYGF